MASEELLPAGGVCGRALPSPSDAASTFELDGKTCFVVREGAGRPPCFARAQVVGRIVVGDKRYRVLLAPEVADQVRPAVDPILLLTRRELEIGVLVAAGKLNKQIAHQLHISVWTVSTYLKRSFCKLQVNNRAELAARIAACLQQSSSGRGPAAPHAAAAAGAASPYLRSEPGGATGGPA
jgi:DNA-binding CsgD family transcriptional regulator